MVDALPPLPAPQVPAPSRRGGRRRAESGDARRSRRSASAVPRGGARRASGQRRAHGLPGTIGVTLLGALLPGSGLVWSGRRALGWLVLLPTVLGLAAAGWYVGRDLRAVLDFATSPTQLKIAAAVFVVGLVAWAGVVHLTYRKVRPLQRSRWHTAVGQGFVVVLCLLVGVPVAYAARSALATSDLVSSVFEGNETATSPEDVTKANPWGDRERVNVLLLGGDGGVGRTGVRTDTVILASISVRTGRTVMFSLPRNMMNAQFPEDSPLHDLYPDGYSGAEDDGFYMLNAIYGQIPERHPGVLGKSKNEGADAIKQAVAGSLGIRVDYYVLANLKGFKDVVDAMGGITVNVNKPVAINGNTDAGIPPTGYIEPGPDQHLDGFHALWFARGRWGSDDYERMERQRCTIDAIIDAADPATLITRYTELAAAGKEVVSSDIPLDLVPAFVELALKVKDANVRSVVFKRSDKFFSGDPDFAWMHETVTRAIKPRSATPTESPSESPSGSPSESPSGTPSGSPTATPSEEPGAAVDARDSCGYEPVEGVEAAGE
ncbi:LCP family protein [Nocardioides lianchengensis]|uniref:Cell envelope-related function transcriptional attenuator common domain-containing protein n=1 Tax=Nocardioides lianchengensis TaxID=1045774 RepID=A0A1G6WNU3_9ACTN|nr:LCP family protein [Nocardioides lianchengensis]NYG09247.1 LCP family protein required for cell wall assembly [Nocardioides lianchengensis]SDD67481.1 cell envelope-related function transcriptional attenuator common domain-containing protein [Nocardioides lianchengensis]